MSEGPQQILPAPGDTPSCCPCDGWDLWVGCEHGDPYVFPGGVAQQDHPFLALGREEDDQLAIP